jgi:antitoxin component of MazEF toxin-antitoxin module
MKMVYRTKMRKNAGSMITVIPSAITNLLNLEQGDIMRWEVKIEGDNALITVIPEKEESSE